MRLVTRGVLDGLTAAVLITTMEDISSIELIHPQDITNNKFQITPDDVMAYLPYHPDCSMWFYHYELTESNLKPPLGFRGRHAIEPSVARVVYNYYSSEKLKKYSHLVAETDRFESASLSVMDVAAPRGVILLGFIIDPRTGLGSFKEFFIKLVGWLKEYEIDEVLAQPEVAERIRKYEEANMTFNEALNENTRVDGNVIVTDFRNIKKVPVGNRFLVYTAYPVRNVSVRVQWGPRKEFVAVTIGHSIFNKTCKTNIGRLCSDYGGGGHKGAGGCVLKTGTADEEIKEIIERLKKNVTDPGD
jgi:hypothetical protein